MTKEQADALRAIGVRGVLVTMAETDVLGELRCMMPLCFCPFDDTYFERKTHPPAAWAPSADHYPILKKDGGRLTPDNVRLSHILCNRLDYALNHLPEERRGAAVERWAKKYGAVRKL